MTPVKRLFLLFALFVVALFVLLQRTNNQNNTSQKPIDITNEATSTAYITAGEIAEVAFVIDGDTIELSDGRRVRYIGINAPEIEHEGSSAECFSDQARNENTRLVKGRMVRLEKDVSDTDGYGRLLRYVYIGNVFINEHLVRDGFARAWTVPPDEGKALTLSSAQQQAKDAGLGLWQLCR